MKFLRKDIEELDKEGVLEQIYNLPNQCRETKALTEKIIIKKIPSCIIICGMGGSGIAADISASYLYKYSNIPFFIVKNYNLPNFVNSSSLIILISYSGETKETLMCYQEAKRRNAEIIGITSGGKLKEELKESSVVLIPSGFLPRCAVGYLTFSLMSIIEKLLGNFKLSEDIEETYFILSQLKEELAIENEQNLAKEIALSIFGKIPLVYGAESITASVAKRWKQQINENSKYLCFYNNFPELTHNEIMGFENIEVAKSQNEKPIFIFLKDESYPEFIIKAMEFFKTNFSIPYIEVNSRGKSLLAKLCSLIYIGDFVSFYLAILNKQSPGRILAIQRLKELIK